MYHFAFLLLLVLAAPSRADVPKLFQSQSFTCATLAEAVNYYVALGEDKAVKELVSLEVKEAKRGISMNERIGWVCRILFEPKGKEPLRQPMFGGLSLPYNSMPLQRWPLFPVAQSGSTYFVLSEGYMLAGVAEPVKDYLAYCRKNGVFRKSPVAVPTREQATKDAASLRKSPEWQAIRWKDGGAGFQYTISESWTWEFIVKQATSISPPVKVQVK